MTYLHEKGEQAVNIADNLVGAMNEERSSQQTGVHYVAPPPGAPRAGSFSGAEPPTEQEISPDVAQLWT